MAFLVVSWENAHVMERLSELPELRVVQVLSAGTDAVEHLIPPGVTLCNARGARDVPVAEWVVGALLGDASGLLRSAARQHERDWRPYRPAEVAGNGRHADVGRDLDDEGVLLQGRRWLDRGSGSRHRDRGGEERGQEA